MPWYWSDDLARRLMAQGRITEPEARGLLTGVVAFKSERETLDEAAEDLAEDDGEASIAA